MTRGQVGKAQALAVAKDMAPTWASSTGHGESRCEGGNPGGHADGRWAEPHRHPLMGGRKEVVIGAVGYDELKGKIGNVAKCGKAVCS